MLFIGLNPSLADSFRDDQTTRKLIGYINRWGYGELIVINLFAKIGKKPNLLKGSIDPIGYLNNTLITYYLLKWAESLHWDLWLGWGSMGSYLNRDLKFMSLLESPWHIRKEFYPFSRGPMAIGKNQKGAPRHPLYLSNQALLTPFKFH